MRAMALWLAGAVAVQLGRMVRQEATPRRVLCLAYHRLAPMSVWDSYRGTERRFSIPVERFTAQVDSLMARGWQFVTLDAVLSHARGERTLPARTALLTFDDGCESVHRYALPALRERGIPAVAFVTTGADAWIFGPRTEHGERRMTPGELRECAAAGIAIGSHGVSHRGLVAMSRAEALSELRGSRALLEEWTGCPVRTVSIPLNFHDGRVRALCREAGFDATFVSDPGAVLPGSGTRRVRRVVVEGGMGLPEFLRSLDPWPMVRRRVFSGCKRLPPRLLGERLWMPLRARLLGSGLLRSLAACGKNGARGPARRARAESA